MSRRFLMEHKNLYQYDPWEFPELSDLDEIMPIVRQHDEFKAVKKEGYTVVNYVLQKPDTFNEKYEPIWEGTKRECRGIIFDEYDKLIRRPFHKFFNYGEKQNTFSDLTKPHVIMHKLDGSMIAPFMAAKDSCRLGTKAGITDVSMNAEVFIATKPNYWNMFHKMIDLGYTPILEWCSNQNRIVLDHKKDSLTLTAIRNMKTGEYHRYKNLRAVGEVFAVPVVDVIDWKGDITALENFTKGLKGSEGFVVSFENGHKMKIKSEWYLRLHKMLEKIKYDRNIAAIILNNELDDIYPKLDKEWGKRVRDFELDFWCAFKSKRAHIQSMCNNAVKEYDGDPKRVALEYAPGLPKMDRWFIFKYIRGNFDVEGLLTEHIKMYLSTNKKFDELWEWMNGEL